jgi:uncharacterized protein involved in exopolysaccharide biosynthesis
MNNSTNIQSIEEDEINLRELFATIGHYKWSIIFLTLFITTTVAIKVYFMPKYYKSTVTIEVKLEDGKSKGFSGGASALLGLGGDTTSNLEKDVTLLKMFRTNEKVLDQVNNYMVRYFIRDDNYKEVEIEDNISINITDIKINDFKKYGMRIIIEPLNKTEYNLYLPGVLKNTLVGKYHYTENVTSEDFSLVVHKKASFNHSYTVELSGTKHYVYEEIIIPNLNIELDKESPFINISLIDNLPNRGEAYLKNLIEIYTQQNIQDIREDASVVMNSYDKQLKNIEKRVDLTSNKLKEYKTNNNIVQPQAQTALLVRELSRVGIQLAQNNYKKELLKNMITFVKKNNNIDAIAPSLRELQDEATISLIKIIQKQQLTLTNLRIKYTNDNPHIVNTYSKINSLKRKVLSNLKNLQKTLESKRKSLKNMENTYKAQIKSTPKKEQQLIGFSRDYQLNTEMYTYLMKKRSENELKRDKAIARFKIIEAIYTADKAVEPKKALIVIVAFFVAFILSISLAFFRNFLKK